MINHKLKCIFIHIPKTSGTSIKNTLEGFDKEVGYHARPQLIEDYNPTVWSNYFKFTFVRNPFDRIYSIYSYYKMGKAITLVNPNKLPDTFENFIMDIDNNLKKLGLDYNQMDFLNLDVDYVGRYETVQVDFDEICTRLGVDERQLNNDRKSKRVKDYKQVYTSEMVTIVSDYFNKDIEKFNYTF